MSAVTSKSQQGQTDDFLLNQSVLLSRAENSPSSAGYRAVKGHAHALMCTQSHTQVFILIHLMETARWGLLMVWVGWLEMHEGKKVHAASLFCLPVCVRTHTLTCSSVCNKWISTAAAGNKCRAIIDRSVSVLSEFCAACVCLHDLVKTPKMLVTYSCPLTFFSPLHPSPPQCLLWLVEVMQWVLAVAGSFIGTERRFLGCSDGL